MFVSDAVKTESNLSLSLCSCIHYTARLFVLSNVTVALNVYSSLYI